MSGPVSPGAAVLVVDDDEGVLALVALALRKAGFDVIEATSGTVALEAIEHQSIAVVVSDVGLPGMSGFDVVRAIRLRPESATLPVILMTGSGDNDSVIEGLSAGADDFLPKPVRLDELVARVRAHLRTKSAWSQEIEGELRTRAGVVAALAHLTPSSGPNEAAMAVTAELVGHIDCEFVSVLELVRGEGLLELATYTRLAGLGRGGQLLHPSVARKVLARARQGPWVEEILPNDVAPRSEAFASADLGVVVGAPIYAANDLVGLLSIGIGRSEEPFQRGRQASLLAAAIDYASVLSAIAGPSLASGLLTKGIQANLRHVLSARQFHPVYQPIVELATGTIVGYEALTRFTDGTAPNVRFAEAASVELGSQFEIAAVAAALKESTGLPAGPFLSVNVSPAVVLQGSKRFRQMIRGETRPLILELTEHVPIEDYGSIRAAIDTLGFTGVAVDDAGAGYASLRHILELEPTFAKLDISLVRGIDGDRLRQALVAGLQYFASQTGCRLIAEGIETAAEAEALVRLGVDLGQGYFLGRPERLPS